MVLLIIITIVVVVVVAIPAMVVVGTARVVRHVGLGGCRC